MAARCARENNDHVGFLLQSCERELLERETRAAQRRLKAARFPTIKTLEGFDFASASKLNKPLVLELLRCDYLDRRENLLLVGGPGTGKTHLATALGVEACGRGKRVRFYRVTELVTLLLEARGARSGPHPCRSRGATARPAEGASLEAGPADPGRVGICAGEQGRGGAALRRDQHGV